MANKGKRTLSSLLHFIRTLLSIEYIGEIVNENSYKVEIECTDQLSTGYSRFLSIDCEIASSFSLHFSSFNDQLPPVVGEQVS